MLLAILLVNHQIQIAPLCDGNFAAVTHNDAIFDSFHIIQAFCRFDKMTRRSRVTNPNIISQPVEGSASHHQRSIVLWIVSIARHFRAIVVIGFTQCGVTVAVLIVAIPQVARDQWWRSITVVAAVIIVIIL